MTAPPCVAGFLRSSANIDGLNAGQALIHVEVRKGHSDCVAALIQAGADVNQRDSEWNGPLTVASFVGSADCVKLLIDAGARVNERNGDRDSPVNVASMAGHADCIRLLVRAGANLDWLDCDGRTALQNACLRGHIDCVVSLLDGGADASGRGGGGLMAVHCSVPSQSVDSLAALITRGAYVDAEDDDGKTPLLHAVSAPDSENVSFVRALLRARANANHAAIDGTTPTHAAAGNGAPLPHFAAAVLRLLRELRADDDAL